MAIYTKVFPDVTETVGKTEVAQELPGVQVVPEIIANDVKFDISPENGKDEVANALIEMNLIKDKVIPRQRGSVAVAFAPRIQGVDGASPRRLVGKPRLEAAGALGATAL